MAIESPKNVTVNIYSITGSLVATFMNNTEGGENLKVKCSENRMGGLDTFSFEVPSTTTEPLFTDMECRIYVDGVWWYTGYADFIPNLDTYDPTIEIEGQGFYHKLEDKTANESYTSQTLAAIVADIGVNYLGSDINVLYNAAKIDVPALSGISISFDDMTLLEVFEELASLANYQYSTQQYTWGVDKEKELYFEEIPNDLQGHLFEGYHYQFPEVSKIGGNSIINQILAYRATSAGSSTTEYVNTYEDAGSKELNGTYEEKITFPSYLDNTTIANICAGILEKNSQPLDRVEIENLEVSDRLPIGFYGLSNRRDKYFLTVNDMEDVADWDLTSLVNTTVTISSDKVFTGRRAMKIVTAAGSLGEKFTYDLPIPVKFPDIFRLFVFLEDINGALTVRLYGSNDNSVDIMFGDQGDQSGEWIKRLVPVSLLLDTGFLFVDESAGNSGYMIVDIDASNSGKMIIDTLVREGVTDIVRVEIEMDTDVATTMYIDALSVQANTYLNREIMLEQIEYELDKSYIVKATFGTKVDSVIDEIKGDVKAGDIALSVFSKQ